MRRGDAAQDGEQPLSESFWTVAKLLRKASLESFARWEVTPSQSRAMRALGRHGALRPSELSAHLRIAARSTTEVVDDLEAKGLAQRRPDPSDRRATLIALTERGVEVGRQIRVARTAEAERIFDRLSATDRAHLSRILHKLADAARDGHHR